MSAERDYWRPWRVCARMGSEMREYTERNPGAAINKLIAEFGVIQAGHFYGATGPALELVEVVPLVDANRTHEAVRELEP